MNKDIKPSVAIIAFPLQSYAPYKFLSNLLKILEPISSNIVIIDGNTERIEVTSDKIKVKDIGVSIHYLKDVKPTLYSAILWIIKCFLTQIKESLELLKIRNEVDCVIFYMSYPYYLLPLIVAKFHKKKTIEVITRSSTNSIFTRLICLQDGILYRLIDGISPESNILIKDLNLEKYKNKLLPEGARFIDVSRYTVKKNLSERNNTIGYIGRITKEKGVMEFIKSIPLIVKENKEIEFLIGGSGDLLDIVKEECNKIKKDYEVKINVTGFINEDEFPTYLNKLKLMILPTQHAEGLPTIILEAMACGTPVVSTSVGGISDLIKDEETGFIIKNNSSKCIAKNVIRAINYPDLNNIVENAHILIEKKYTYNSAVKRYGLILRNTLNK